MRRDITTQQRLYLSLKVRIRLYQNISQSVTYVLTTKILIKTAKKSGLL